MLTLMQTKNAEEHNHSFGIQSRIQDKRGEVHKEEYESSKRESKLSRQDADKAKVTSKQPKIVDPNSGFAMLVSAASNFVMDKSVCYIGKKMNADQLASEDA